MVDLNGRWCFKCTKDSEWLEAQVPGSVYTDLLKLNLIEDPFYSDNEDKVKTLSENDYEYKKKFCIEDEVLMKPRVTLECEGIDTLADIYINGSYIGHTENMHRSYSFEIKDKLVSGENEIYIKVYSPLEYISRKDEEKALWGMNTTIDGYPHIRKAHSMFGWDFGPQLPDMGIYRGVQIKTYEDIRIGSTYIKQRHEQSHVVLGIDVEIEGIMDSDTTVEVVILYPNQDKQYKQIKPIDCEQHFEIHIEDPQKWWPNGYGEQPLYSLSVYIKQGETVVDEHNKKIGLRTLTVRRKKEHKGRGFCFEINGIEIFAMGANYIPEDSLLGRRSKEKTKRLLESCINSHFNCIRVWGGGIYPDNYFYDLCDELGLIVWQDFMFACGVYELTNAFKENIMKEFEDVLKRIRNHACLGILCGNNEMEAAWVQWGLPDDKKLKEDYIELFERMIPEVVKQYAPEIFYWPASPSSGGGFVDPNSYDNGNVHYWDVWHGRKMFEECRKYYFRFASEYGFQSFPSLKTVKTFLSEEPYNIYSYDMDRHQKCRQEGYGTRVIMDYMGVYYKQPTSFENTIYMSQVLQGDYLQIAIEHWRRNRGRCMGSIYWQINDCWPGTTWATIDHYGRWKASQYYAKRAYAPVLISALYRKEDGKVTLHVTNDTLQVFKGKVKYQWVHQSKGISEEKIIPVEIKALKAEKVLELSCDFTDKDARDTYLRYELIDEQEEVKSTDTLLFVKSKYFKFNRPKIEVTIEQRSDEIYFLLTSDVFARRVEIDFEDIDLVLEDNYFDIYPNQTRVVKVCKSHIDGISDLSVLKQQLRIRTINEI